MTWPGVPPYPRSVPRDDELRKVAEDIRALARSLARDFREAVDQSRARGHPPGEAIKRGLKDVAGETKRGVKDTWTNAGPSGPYWNNKYWQREWARHNRYRARYGNKYWFPPAPPPGVPGSPPGEPAGGVLVQDGPPPVPPTPWHPHRRRSSLPPVRRRWDGTTIFGTLAVLFGFAWLLSAVHAIHVSVEGVVAVGLMLLGAAMIVTGRTDWSLSRKSWPVWLGLGLIVVLLATSRAFGGASAADSVSFGDKTVTVAHSGEQISGGFGTLTVNAANLVNGGHLTVSNIAGNVKIALPQNTQTIVNAKMAAGEICAGGHHRSDGVGASTHAQIPPANPPASGTPPVLTIDVHESFGQIVVGGPGCSR